MIDMVYIASGFFVGALVGMTGVGGGSLMTPLLILLLGFHPVTAVGTDLLFAANTKIVGTLVHGFSRNVTWRVVMRLAAGSVPATAVTLLVLSRFPLHSNGARAVITTVLGLALVLTAAGVFWRRWLITHMGARLGRLSPQARDVLTVLTGAILGTFVSISSVGAGALGVTALILLYPQQPTARIVGTDIAHAVPLTLLAGFGHWLIGSVNFPLLGLLLTGSLPGIVLGSVYANWVPDAVLRPVFASVLLLVGARLLF